MASAPSPPPLPPLVAGAGAVGAAAVDFDPDVDRDVAVVPVALSFELNKLWKKFCRTSCCVWPPGVGLGDEDNVGDDTCDLDPGAPTPGTDKLDAGRVVLRLSGFLVSAPALIPSGAGPPTAPSISVRARSTFGRLKLLLPMGPTIPADAVSLGLRNAPRGSRFGFFAFSS